MLKRLIAILMLTVVVSAGGALVGYVVGSMLYERALYEVETSPSSIKIEKASYLCAAGYLPIELGVFGTGLGFVIGIGAGLGGAIWSEAKEQEAERE